MNLLSVRRANSTALCIARDIDDALTQTLNHSGGFNILVKSRMTSYSTKLYFEALEVHFSNAYEVASEDSPEYEIYSETTRRRKSREEVIEELYGLLNALKPTVVGAARANLGEQAKVEYLVLKPSIKYGMIYMDILIRGEL